MHIMHALPRSRVGAADQKAVTLRHPDAEGSGPPSERRRRRRPRPNTQGRVRMVRMRGGGKFWKSGDEGQQ